MVSLSYRALRGTCSREGVIKVTQVEKHVILSTCAQVVWKATCVGQNCPAVIRGPNTISGAPQQSLY